MKNFNQFFTVVLSLTTPQWIIREFLDRPLSLRNRLGRWDSALISSTILIAVSFALMSVVWPEHFWAETTAAHVWGRSGIVAGLALSKSRCLDTPAPHHLANAVHQRRREAAFGDLGPDLFGLRWLEYVVEIRQQGSQC